MLFSSFFLVSVAAFAAATPLAVQKRAVCPGATAWTPDQIKEVDTTDIYTGVKTRKTVASVFALCPKDKAATVTFEVLVRISILKLHSIQAFADLSLEQHRLQ